MASSVVVSFKDLRPVELVRSEVERRCDALALEFPETTRFEIILAPDGVGFTAHAHVTGNHTEVAAHAAASELAPAAEKLLVAVERQLRKLHDKKIFAHRREAQRDRTRKTGR